MDLIRLMSQAVIFMTGDTYQKDGVLMNKNREKSDILSSSILGNSVPLLRSSSDRTLHLFHQRKYHP